MNYGWKVVVLCAIASSSLGEDRSFQDCFKEDSISCLQMQIFLKTKEVTDKPKIELISGMSLLTIDDRNGKSVEHEFEKEVRKASDVESRQRALETYLMAVGKSLWNGRTLNWNPMQTARSLADSIPDSMRNQITTVLTEGRGKKKQLKMMLPLVVALMLKFAAVLALTYMGIAAIAKKAILAAVISLVISGFIGIKNLFATQPTVHTAEVVGYHTPPDWDTGYGHNDLLTSASEISPQRRFFIGNKSNRKFI